MDDVFESEAFAHGCKVFTAGLVLVALEAHLGNHFTTKQTQAKIQTDLLELVGYYSDEEWGSLIVTLPGLMVNLDKI